MIKTVKKHENSTIQENKQKRLAKFYKNSKNKPNNVDGPTNHVVTRVYRETSPMPIKPKIIVPVVNVDVVEKAKPIVIPFFNFINSPHIANETHSFSFVISSYNNEENIYNNLLSIIFQTYSNWHIFYTNDCSTDNTHDLFWKIVNEYKIQDKVTYIRNYNNMKQAYCKYNMYKNVDSNSIIIILDGDDWLSSSNVLNTLHNAYLNTNALFIYTGYKIYNNNIIENTVSAQPYPINCIQNGMYRFHPKWLFSHLRTGYAWLFKMIPKSYLMINDQWIDRCTDLAEIYCVTEIAKERVYNLQELCCIYNKANSIHYDNSYYIDYNSQKRLQIQTFVKQCTPLHIYIPSIFIINLPEDIQNKESLLYQLNYYNITNVHVFNAHHAINNPKTVQIHEQYISDYNHGLIQQSVFNITKKHLSIGALGLIISTLQLYKYLNSIDIDHTLILEDDVYIKNDFHNCYHITNADILHSDFIYIGHNSTNTDLLDIKKHNTNFFDLKDPIFQNIHIYGTYSYICSKHFRTYVLNIGLDFFINNNLPIDCFFIHCYKDKTNDFNMKLFNHHLFIPEVRKDGIQKKRDMSFYTDRQININDYMIPNPN